MSSARIEVYCQEASHAEKRWNIGTFERDTDGRWRIDDYNAHGGDKQTLNGNRRLPAVLMVDETKGVDTTDERDRYPLRCDLCTLGAPVRDGSRAMAKLQTMLEKLALAGRVEISLAQLVARLV